MPKISRTQGFTLMEVIISLMVLAIVATMGVIGLRAILTTDSRQEQITDELAELQFAYLLIQRDLAQVILRPITDSRDEKRPGFLGSSGTVHGLEFDIAIAGNLLIEFTRDGVANPQQLNDRSTLQRVTYTYDGEKLRRFAWLALDRFSDSAYLEHDVLANIKDLQLTYYDRYAQPFNQWSTQISYASGWMRNFQQMQVLPAAVEWRFEHPRYGEIIWLFLMPGAEHEEPPQ